MAIAEFTDKCRDDFNIEERKKIEKFAEEMFKKDIVMAFLPIGKKEVCLERENSRESTIRIFCMNETLEMNERLVTKFNKRKKAG